MAQHGAPQEDDSSEGLSDEEMQLDGVNVEHSASLDSGEEASAELTGSDDGAESGESDGGAGGSDADTGAQLDTGGALPGFSSEEHDSDREGEMSKHYAGSALPKQQPLQTLSTACREAGGAAPATEHSGPFKSADKGAAIAKAFAKVTHGSRVDTDGSKMLSGSKSVLKRQREEQDAEAVDRKARQLRQEMKRRGHLKIAKHGEDPEQDTIEKALMRTARRGVVRLFNAVSKAQKQQVEAKAVGGRGKAQLSKADFLAELRGTKKVEASAPATTAGVGRGAAAAAAEQPAWEALQDDFASLQSGLRMKDWDKEEAGSTVVEETLQPEEVSGGSDSD